MRGGRPLGLSSFVFLVFPKQGFILLALCNSIPHWSKSSEPSHSLHAREPMDMSVLGAGIQHALFPPLPVPSPVSPSPTTARSAWRNSQFKAAATTTTTRRTLGEEPPSNVKKNNGNSAVTVVRKRRHSKSYLQRQSAILEVQQASDLDSAIARCFYPLTVAFVLWVSWLCQSLLCCLFLRKHFWSFEEKYRLGFVTSGRKRGFLYAIHGHALDCFCS